MMRRTTVPPGLPPPGLSPTPKALLWAYQLTRENESLTDYVQQVKGQLNDTEEFAQSIQKCLNKLVETVTSLAHIRTNKAQTDNDKHQLLLLRRQLQYTVGPLCEYGQSLVKKNKNLVECIAALGGLDALSAELGSEVEGSASGSATWQPSISAQGSELSGSELSSNIFTSPPALPGNTSIFLTGGGPCSTQQPQPDTPIDPLQTTLATLMKQNNRSLDDYFDTANIFRRDQRPLTPSTEKALVAAFIAGCDNALYRRRLTHALRKAGFNWTWLTHEVQFLVLEEEFMEKQKFALAHRNADGSVMWPDGSTRMRFMPLEPVREEDLTSSEEEEL